MRLLGKLLIDEGGHRLRALVDGSHCAATGSGSDSEDHDLDLVETLERENPRVSGGSAEAAEV